MSRCTYRTYGQHPEDYVATCGFDAQDDLEATKYALRIELVGWSPELLDAIEKSAKEGLVWRDLYQFPVGFTWPHKPGVTLLGDAAHVMTPFAGIGVNTAFYDAIVLSEQIVAYTVDADHAHPEVSQVERLDAYVRLYEKAMFAHTHTAQRRTEGAKDAMLFTP